LLGASHGDPKAGWFKRQRNYWAAAVDRGKGQKLKVAQRYASHLHPASVTPACAGMTAPSLNEPYLFSKPTNQSTINQSQVTNS